MECSICALIVMLPKHYIIAPMSLANRGVGEIGRVETIR